MATCGGEVELEVDGLAGPISEVVANGSSVLVVSLGRKKWVDGGGKKKVDFWIELHGISHEITKTNIY